MFATKIVVKTSLIWSLTGWQLVAAGTSNSVLVSGALWLLNLFVRLLSGDYVKSLRRARWFMRKGHHDFQDVTIGHMIRQHIEARNLMGLSLSTMFTWPCWEIHLRRLAKILSQIMVSITFFLNFYFTFVLNLSAYTEAYHHFTLLSWS